MQEPVARGNLVGAAVFAALASACTLFSGWSDLQNGPLDAGSNSDDDASAEGDADASAHCTPASCAPRVCCVHKDGTSGCVDSCIDPGDATAAVACASARDCSSVGGVCCLSVLSFQATCTPTCLPSIVACQQDDPGACPAPTKCTREGDGGGDGFWLCQ